MFNLSKGKAKKTYALFRTFTQISGKSTPCRRTVDVFFNAVKRSKRRKAGKKCLFFVQ